MFVLWEIWICGSLFEQVEVLGQPRIWSGTCYQELLQGIACPELLWGWFREANRTRSEVNLFKKASLFEVDFYSWCNYAYWYLQLNRFQLFRKNIRVEIQQHVILGLFATKLHLIFTKFRCHHFNFANLETGRANFPRRRRLSSQHPIVGQIRRVFQASNARKRNVDWMKRMQFVKRTGSFVAAPVHANEMEFVLTRWKDASAIQKDNRPGCPSWMRLWFRKSF